jgi:hypothetical protein
MTCCFSKFMYFYWFRPYRGLTILHIRLLDTKSDELKPIFLWNDREMVQLDPDQHCVVDP